MKVLISKSVFGVTGSAQCSQDIIRYLINNNHSLTVISLEGNNGFSFETKQNDLLNKLKWFIFYKSSTINNNISFFKKLYWKLKFPIVRYFNKRKINKLNIRHLIVNSTGSLDLLNEISLSGAKYFHKTLVVHESPDITKFKEVKKNKEYYSQQFSFFSDYIFVSKIVRDKWINFINLDRDKTHYIPNTIREDLTKNLLTKNIFDLKKECSLSMESKTILCIGSIQYLKGQDLLIEASKKLWNSGHYDFDLVLIGDVYESFGLKIMNMINQLKIDYPIKHKKPVSPFMALKYIASADIIVLPSRTEALPRVILEGMALKKPIIASDVGGVSELIENNVQGLVFNAEDINQLSNYMEILLNDNLIKKNLSEKAHEKYWNFYSRKIYNKNWSNFLDRLD